MQSRFGVSRTLKLLPSFPKPRHQNTDGTLDTYRFRGLIYNLARDKVTRLMQIRKEMR
jgi:hypothetical protein